MPHAGCPHRCSFCNQKTISGSVKPLSADDVDRACRIALDSGKVSPDSSEIAFFGGSFTAIDSAYMTELLAAADKYIKDGYFKGVRISTRPDCIDREILGVLKSFSVTSIELGAQSMSDKVLSINERGHTSDDVRNASALIREFGFELGLQMMTGLMGSDRETDLFTGREIIKLCPETVRIYPTVVLENTALAEHLKDGSYIPPSLDETVGVCSELLEMFNDAGIRVIRLGLHSGGGVDGGYLAGAYHPALRELCEGEIYLKKMLSALSGKDKSRSYIIEVSKYALSKAKGQSKRNEKALKNQGFCCIIKGNEFLKEYEIKVKEN